MRSHNETLEEVTQGISEEIANKKYSIDDSLLVKCEWFDSYKDGDLLSIEEVHRRNANKARDCYVIHNSLVETLELINKGHD